MKFIETLILHGLRIEKYHLEAQDLTVLDYDDELVFDCNCCGADNPQKDGFVYKWSNVYYCQECHDRILGDIEEEEAAEYEQQMINEAINEKWDATILFVENACKKNGWTIENIHYSQTGTRYYTIEGLLVRIADHSDCYCDSDINVCVVDTSNLDGILPQFFEEVFVKLINAN